MMLNVLFECVVYGCVNDLLSMICFGFSVMLKCDSWFVSYVMLFVGWFSMLVVMLVFLIMLLCDMIVVI